MSRWSATRGSGKTQLVSALLFDAGAVNRLGSVDDGTTVTDYDEEEIARKHTLSASVAYAEWNKTKINFIDTPGMANFLSDARAALRVADAALVVVDAVSRRRGVDREGLGSGRRARRCRGIIVLNRLDRERASLERSLESLRGVFGRTVIPIQLPIGEEKAFHGVVDLVAMKACTFASDGSGKPVGRRRFPATWSATANAAREALIEMVAEADDALMEKFFDAGTLDAGRSGRRAASAASRAARIFPVVLHLGDGEHRHAAAARRDRQPTCRRRRSGRCTARTRDGEDVEVATDATAGAGRARSCGRPSRIRSPGASRCSASSRARSRPTRRCTTSTKDTPERLGHLIAAPGQDARRTSRRSRPATSAPSPS